jgi:hypothetical protein
MVRTKAGKIIIPNNLYPEKHELATANVFTKLGKDVEFISPNRAKGSKTPDIRIDNKLWEMKCPQGSSKNTIYNALKRGVKQSKNIIIDLRVTKIPDEHAKKYVQNSKSKVKSLKVVILITKSGKIIELD